MPIILLRIWVEAQAWAKAARPFVDFAVHSWADSVVDIEMDIVVGVGRKAAGIVGVGSRVADIVVVDCKVAGTVGVGCKVVDIVVLDTDGPQRSCHWQRLRRLSSQIPLLPKRCLKLSIGW